MATSLTLQNDASLAQGYVKVNGTTSATFTTGGLSTPQATIGSIDGILKATGGVVSQAVAGTDYLTSASGGAITLGTAQTPSGVSTVDFTGIPSWAKRITVMFDSVSLTGTDSLLVQLGYSGGFEITGYESSSMGTNGSSGGNVSSTSGFAFRLAGGSASASGHMVITNISSNKWVSSHSATYDGSTASITGGGVKTISGGTLTQVRITRSGTDTFDAGTINISYE